MLPLQARANSTFAPFDALASTYDQVFTFTEVGRAQREGVWSRMDRIFKPGDRILEINCGTGMDAIHMAQRGIQVVACDASTEMIRAARHHSEEAGVLNLVECVALKTENIFLLGKNYQFDGLLSNFCGLNCSQDLASIARDLSTLIKPGGRALICVFSPFCAWEIAWHLLHGNVRKAFRRFRRLTTAQFGEGATFRVYHHSLRRIRQSFAPFFELKQTSGIGILVPPSYANAVARRFPRLLKLAKSADNIISPWSVFRNVADHILLEFECTAACPQ